jgi:hypothetical protein
MSGVRCVALEPAVDRNIFVIKTGLTLQEFRSPQSGDFSGNGFCRCVINAPTFRRKLLPQFQYIRIYRPKSFFQSETLVYICKLQSGKLYSFCFEIRRLYYIFIRSDCNSVARMWGSSVRTVFLCGKRCFLKIYTNLSLNFLLQDFDKSKSLKSKMLRKKPSSPSICMSRTTEHVT